MKLVDMKLPKKSKEQLKEETAPEPIREEYPWGLELNFGKEEIRKLVGLQNIQAGTIVNIQAIGKATRVEVTDKEKGRSRHNVQIQVQKIAIAPKTKEKAASFNNVVTTIAEARRA